MRPPASLPTAGGAAAGAGDPCPASQQLRERPLGTALPWAPSRLGARLLASLSGLLLKFRNVGCEGAFASRNCGGVRSLPRGSAVVVASPTTCCPAAMQARAPPQLEPGVASRSASSLRSKAGNDSARRRAPDPEAAGNCGGLCGGVDAGCSMCRAARRATLAGLSERRRWPTVSPAGGTSRPLMILSSCFCGSSLCSKAGELATLIVPCGGRSLLFSLSER